MYAYIATYIFHYLHAYGITVAQAYTKLNCNNYTDSIACYTLYYKAIKMLRIARMALLQWQWCTVVIATILPFNTFQWFL